MDHDPIPEEPEPWWRRPLTLMLAVFLLLLLVLWLPATFAPFDPEPRDIPSLDEVVPAFELGEPPIISLPEDYPAHADGSDRIVKQVADRVVTASCDGGQVCHAKALYSFVRDEFDYVSDPDGFEYVKSARESLVTHGGDCDDASILLASLLRAVGIPVRFVFIPGHVYLQAYLPDASRRYHVEDEDWVSLDPTCDGCAFGELPYASLPQQKRIIS